MPSCLTAKVGGIAFTAMEYLPKTPNNITLFCLPGGGTNAEYYNLAPENSFVEIMRAKGFRVITMDHPGTVSNPLPDNHAFLKPRQSADYITSAISYWTRDEESVVGVGHSMGGMMATLVQARARPFRGLALLGSSAGGLDWGLSEDEKAYIERPDALERDLEKLTLSKFKTQFPISTGGPSGKSITFGGETPELTQSLREVSCELYAAGGMMSMTRGSFRKEVEAIDIPMFFSFGDNDIGIPPEDVPKDYTNAAMTDLVILENTGHNHFAFKSINRLCNKLNHWASNLA